jgi:hypothetical protein
MNEQVLDEDVARKFLLGQLPTEVQWQIEELAFDDVDSYTFLESVEEDLIDEYLQGELSSDEHKRFEQHFLSFPGRRDNLKLSRILQQHFSPEVVVPCREVSPRPRISLAGWFQSQQLWLRLSFAVAALLLLVFIVWLFIRTRESERPAPMHAISNEPVPAPTQSSSASPSPQPAQSPSQIENKNRSQPPDRLPERSVYATLVPSASVRSTGGLPLRIPSDSKSEPVGLPLLKDNYRSYEATLRNEADEELHRWSDLRPIQIKGEGKGLEIDMPFAKLQLQQQYRIVVRGLTSKGAARDVARYPFQVVSQ